MSKVPLYFVFSTHWDREWYQTFQDYRYRLVGLMDEVLDGIYSGEMKGPFYMDGQTCMLEDYIEIRPERRDELVTYIKADRLVLGPWYVLPDEFLVSGESIIRNIRLGFETIRHFQGQPSKAGFLCDMFGHVSQMPQIFRGFGIKAGFIWRGTDVGKRNVLWEGADGTKLPTYVFGSDGYGEYAIIVRQCTKCYEKFNPEEFRKLIEKFIDQEKKSGDIDAILLFDGVDHQFWDRGAYKELFDYFADDDRFDLKHVSLDEYAERLVSERNKIKKVISGELREVACDFKTNEWLIHGVLSSRVDIKQANAYCQNVLCNWAEPFAIISESFTGQKYPSGFLAVAWKWLIKNHPHDSICGCGIDQIHEDMIFRFNQSRLIAERLTQEALENITICVDVDITDDQLKVVVFNPVPVSRCEVVILPLEIPTDWPIFKEFFGFEKLPTFRILDADGNQIEYQRISQKLGQKQKVMLKTKTLDLYDTTQVNVALKLSLPALGYRTLIIQKAQINEPVRHSSNHKICHSGNCLENEHLKITVSMNGTLEMLDKASNQLYTDLLVFEENADIGDGWYHGIAINDEIINCMAGNARISIVNNGPELATIKVRTSLRLPEEFCFDSMTRSSKLNEFIIETMLTLRADSQMLELETFVDNNIKDHRLRVVFPTHTSGQMYLTDSVFDVVERPVALSKDNYKCKELDVETMPQQSWTAISDESRGLAVISTGLYEACVSDEYSKPIKLTLFRSTRKTFTTSGEPKGQLLKPLSFKYVLMPVSGKIDRIRMFQQACALAGGTKHKQVRRQDLDVAQVSTKLAPQQGFISVDGAVLTSVSKFKNNLEVRLFNPCEDQQCAKVKFQSKELIAKFKKVWATDFDSNKLKNIEIKSGTIELELNAKEILTLVLE